MKPIRITFRRGILSNQSLTHLLLYPLPPITSSSLTLPQVVRGPEFWTGTYQNYISETMFKQNTLFEGFFTGSPLLKFSFEAYVFQMFMLYLLATNIIT